MRLIKEYSLLNLDKALNKLIYTPNSTWDILIKSRLVESFLLGVPIPHILCTEESYGKYTVLDGHKRVTTLIDFYQGKFKLFDLPLLKDLEGLSYTDLNEQYQRITKRNCLNIVLLLSDDPVDTSILKSHIILDRYNSKKEKLEKND